MSQTWEDDCYNYSGHTVTADMQAIEKNFECLKSMFYGTSASLPTPTPGMIWFDSAKKLPKIRNNADDAWLGIMQANATYKIWVYVNAAIDGWAVDSAITDKVIALKGGQYGATGGTTGGSFTLGSHTLSDANLNPHTHGEAAGHLHTLSSNYIVGLEIGNPYQSAYTTFAHGQVLAYSDASWIQGNASYYRADTGGAHTHTSVGSGTAVTHDANYRPAAALGTLQYMDI